MRYYVTLTHETSSAARKVQLLRFCSWRAWIWWPLCGVYAVDLSGDSPTGRLFSEGDGRACLWCLVPSDVKRLQRRRPLSLYQSAADDPDA